MVKLRQRMKRSWKRRRNKRANRERRKRKRLHLARRAVKVSPAQVIGCHVDETYFDGKGGFIQTAIPIPTGQPETLVLNEIQALLTRYSKFHITEFKASKLKQGNLPVYRDFLRLIVNTVALIGDQSPLRIVVSFEGEGRYAGNAFDWVNNQVVGALANLGVHDEPHLAAEFSRQILWIWRFFSKLCPSPIANRFAFVFDNKHRYAQKCLALKPISLPGGGTKPWEQRKWMRSFANTMLPRMEPKKAFSEIETFTFEFSQNSYFIQAADLISNLFFNSLKFSKGIVTDTTKLKHQLLMQVAPGLVFPPELLNALTVVGTELQCSDATLAIVTPLDPEPESTGP